MELETDIRLGNLDVGLFRQCLRRRSAKTVAVSSVVDLYFQRSKPERSIREVAGDTDRSGKGATGVQMALVRLQ